MYSIFVFVCNLIISLVFTCTAYYSNKGSEEVEINDERGIGDYPVLPWTSAQVRSPYGWWDTQDRRNKEDPVCINNNYAIVHIYMLI